MPTGGHSKAIRRLVKKRQRAHQQRQLAFGVERKQIDATMKDEVAMHGIILKKDTDESDKKIEGMCGGR